MAQPRQTTWYQPRYPHQPPAEALPAAPLLLAQGPPCAAPPAASAPAMVYMRPGNYPQPGAAVHYVAVPGVPGGPRYISPPMLQRSASSGRHGSRDLARQALDSVQRTAFEALSINVPTFNCRICFENLPIAERSTFLDCHVPDHACCRECTSLWMKGLIESGQVHSIACGRRGNVECAAVARPEEVQLLTDEETFAKYQRFMQMRDDATVRECPKCSQLCKPQLKDGGEILAEMTCPSCRTEFCYYHSAAHAGRPCEEYERQMAKQEKEMQSGALADSKQCPKCGVHTVKISGCNHMTCAERTCKCHWCWVCGEEIVGGAEGVMAHYSTGNCRQFSEVVATPGCLFNFMWVATLPFRLFFQLSALLLFIVTLLISPITALFFFSCSVLSNDCGKHLCRSERFLKALLLMPGILAYAAIVFAWFILLAGCFGVLMMLWSWLVFCCGDPCPDCIRADHTHAIWITTLPFTALEPGRCILQWYIRRFTCCCCCCCCNSDASDSEFTSEETDEDGEAEEAPRL